MTTPSSGRPLGHRGQLRKEAAPSCLLQAVKSRGACGQGLSSDPTWPAGFPEPRWPLVWRPCVELPCCVWFTVGTPPSWAASLYSVKLATDPELISPPPAFTASEAHLLQRL